MTTDKPISRNKIKTKVFHWCFVRVIKQLDLSLWNFGELNKIYDEISKIAHLNWWRKVKKKFWLEHLPHTIFLIRIAPRTIISNSWTCENKIVLNQFKHCRPAIKVSLASSTLTVPILIPKWGQKMTKERQGLLIRKYAHFYHSFLALFLHFFGISRCKWIF